MRAYSSLCCHSLCHAVHHLTRRCFASYKSRIWISKLDLLQQVGTCVRQNKSSLHTPQTITYVLADATPTYKHNDWWNAPVRLRRPCCAATLNPSLPRWLRRAESPVAPSIWKQRIRDKLRIILTMCDQDNIINISYDPTIIIRYIYNTVAEKGVTM